MITLQTDSGRHPYRQIVAQLRLAIAAGQLAPGQRLASVRGLASQLGVNPLTVARAYRTLAGEGLVVGQQGRGVFVAADVQASADAASTQLDELLAEATAVAVRLGLDLAEASARLAAQWRQSPPSPGRPIGPEGGQLYHQDNTPPPDPTSQMPDEDVTLL